MNDYGRYHLSSVVTHISWAIGLPNRGEPEVEAICPIFAYFGDSSPDNNTLPESFTNFSDSLYQCGVGASRLTSVGRDSSLSGFSGFGPQTPGLGR